MLKEPRFLQETFQQIIDREKQHIAISAIAVMASFSTYANDETDAIELASSQTLHALHEYLYVRFVV